MSMPSAILQRTGSATSSCLSNHCCVSLVVMESLMRPTQVSRFVCPKLYVISDNMFFRLLSLSEEYALLWQNEMTPPISSAVQDEIIRLP